MLADLVREVVYSTLEYAAQAALGQQAVTSSQGTPGERVRRSLQNAALEVADKVAGAAAPVGMQSGPSLRLTLLRALDSELKSCFGSGSLGSGSLGPPMSFVRSSSTHRMSVQKATLLGKDDEQGAVAKEKVAQLMEKNLELQRLLDEQTAKVKELEGQMYRLNSTAKAKSKGANFCPTCGARCQVCSGKSALLKDKEKLHALDSVDQRLGPPQDGGGALALKSEMGNRALENIPRPKAREDFGLGAVLAPPPVTVPSGAGRALTPSDIESGGLTWFPTSHPVAKRHPELRAAGKGRRRSASSRRTSEGGLRI